MTRPITVPMVANVRPERGSGPVVRTPPVWQRAPPGLTRRAGDHTGQNTGMSTVARSQKMTFNGPPTLRKSLNRYCPGP